MKGFTCTKLNIHGKELEQALNSFIAPSTSFLKSTKFVNTLALHLYIILNFILTKNNLWVLLWGKGISEEEFYIQNPRQFETQLIKTTK